MKIGVQMNVADDLMVKVNTAYFESLKLSKAERAAATSKRRRPIKVQCHLPSLSQGLSNSISKPSHMEHM